MDVARGVTALDLVMFVARGIVLSAALLLMLLLAGMVPAHRTGVFIALVTVVGVSASVWFGLDLSI